jgi:hypothetical protein
MPPSDPMWSVRATAWYESLAESGQSKYFEPSDWQYARLLADLLSGQEARERGPSAEMMKHILSAMGNLGTTEADRRRMRVEVERDQAEQGPAPDVLVMDKYRRAAGG